MLLKITRRLFGKESTKRIIIFLLGFAFATIYHSIGRFSIRSSSRANRPSIMQSNDAMNDGNQLSKKVRVMCLVLTTAKNHRSRADHVKATWGSRCDKLIFISSTVDESLPAIKGSQLDTKRSAWAKVKRAFRHAYEHHLEEFDWFLKADDDTYVIMENLRGFLSNQSVTQPMVFGCQLHYDHSLMMSYMDGGAGYVLNKAALKKLGGIELLDPTKGPFAALCDIFDQFGFGRYHPEDTTMSQVLDSLRVTFGDSRDSLGRHQFFTDSPEGLLQPHVYKSLLLHASYHPIIDEKGCNFCSRTPISLHHLTPDRFYTFEYLLYHAKPPAL